jgi:hypothetical protein
MLTHQICPWFNDHDHPVKRLASQMVSDRWRQHFIVLAGS